MGQIGRVALKRYFETGDFPTQDEFIDLIDSVLNIIDNASYSFSGQAHGGNTLHSFSASKDFDFDDGNIQEMPIEDTTTLAVSNLQIGAFILHLPVTVGTAPTINIGASLGTKYTTSADLVNANGDENTITVIKFPSGVVRYTISNIVA